MIDIEVREELQVEGRGMVALTTELRVLVVLELGSQLVLDGYEAEAVEVTVRTITHYVNSIKREYRIVVGVLGPYPNGRELTASEFVQVLKRYKGQGFQAEDVILPQE